MEKMTLVEFRERYGDNSSIAAPAGNRICCRDKLRAPGAREKKLLLLQMMERGEIACFMVGDISKAHRRFKHHEEEHGDAR